MKTKNVNISELSQTKCPQYTNNHRKRKFLEIYSMLMFCFPFNRSETGFQQSSDQLGTKNIRIGNK